ncbi:MAG: TlpA family protein disulfide reductase [Clostridia bacterium]|nr:TlpA family protein disulfide reductase [Clostridia bacterium]
MAALLAGALIYYNFIDSNTTDMLPGDDTTTESGETADPSPEDQPPIGVEVGKTCPPLSLDLLAGGEGYKLNVGETDGKVTVLNFWYTTCGPCIEELPHFYEAAIEYTDSVRIAAVHVEQSGVDAMAWLNENHPEWTDGNMLIGWDTGKVWANLFRIQACPVTIILDDRGVITDYFTGSVTASELTEAVEKALGE